MMILHYLKMAIRNLRKYALQNTVSILGLALGFVALSLSAYWYRYDNTYDKFHKDWERIFNIQSKTTSILPDDNSYMTWPEEFINSLLEIPETESVATCIPHG